MKVEKRKISSLKGIGEKTEKLFQKIGVDTVEDLIRYYPKGFEIFEDPISVGEVEEGKVCTVAGMVFGRIQVSTNSKMQITTLHLKDVVSNAVFEEYTRKRRDTCSARSYRKKEK